MVLEGRVGKVTSYLKHDMQTDSEE